MEETFEDMLDQTTRKDMTVKPSSTRLLTNTERNASILLRMVQLLPSQLDCVKTLKTSLITYAGFAERQTHRCSTL